jgi:hypothetical protein
VKIYNRYVLTIAVVLLLSTVWMIAAAQQSLGLYATVYIVEAMVITELHVYLNKKARRGLSYVSALLFGCFAFILFFQIVKILT